MVADRIGIRQGSLFYYFTSKEAALEEVCAKRVGDFIAGLAAILDGPGSVEDKLRAAVANHLLPIIKRPDSVRTFVNQRPFLPGASRRNIGRQVRRYERMVARPLEDCVAGGRFDPRLDREIAALRLITECNGVFALFGRRARKRSIEDIAKAVAGGFLLGAARRK
jgi:AcrR family transcriptional regulator